MVAVPGAMVTAGPSVAPVQCAHFVNDLLRDHTEWLYDKGLNMCVFSELRFDIFNFQRDGVFWWDGYHYVPQVGEPRKFFRFI